MLAVEVKRKLLMDIDGFSSKYITGRRSEWGTIEELMMIQSMRRLHYAGNIIQSVTISAEIHLRKNTKCTELFSTNERGMVN
jgi:hypothetical protein